MGFKFHQWRCCSWRSNLRHYNASNANVVSSSSSEDGPTAEHHDSLDAVMSTAPSQWMSLDALIILTYSKFDSMPPRPYSLVIGVAPSMRFAEVHNIVSVSCWGGYRWSPRCSWILSLKLSDSSTSVIASSQRRKTPCFQPCRSTVRSLRCRCENTQG